MAKKKGELVSRLVRTMDVLEDTGRFADSAATAALDMVFDGNEMAALRWIGARGAVTMRALADGLGIPSSSATSLIDRLVSQGVVERLRHEHDRRVVLVSLDQKGKSVWQRLQDERAKLCQEMLGNFGPAEQLALTDLLTRMTQIKPSGAADVPSDRREG